MLIEEILVYFDPNGLYEHDQKILLKLSGKYKRNNCSLDRFEFAQDYLSLLLDSNQDLDELETNSSVIEFFKSKSSEFSSNFIDKIISIFNGEEFIADFRDLDIEEEMFLKRFLQLLGNEEFFDFEILGEMENLLNITIENLNLDLEQIEQKYDWEL